MSVQSESSSGFSMIGLIVALLVLGGCLHYVFKSQKRKRGSTKKSRRKTGGQHEMYVSIFIGAVLLVVGLVGLWGGVIPGCGAETCGGLAWAGFAIIAVAIIYFTRIGYGSSTVVVSKSDN